MIKRTKANDKRQTIKISIIHLVISIGDISHFSKINEKNIAFKYKFLYNIQRV